MKSALEPIQVKSKFEWLMNYPRHSLRFK